MTEEAPIHDRSDREVLLSIHGKVCRLDERLEVVEKLEDRIKPLEVIVERGKGISIFLMVFGGLITGLVTFWDNVTSVFRRG